MPRAAGEAGGSEVNAVIDAMSRVPWDVACSIAKAVDLSLIADAAEVC